MSYSTGDVTTEGLADLGYRWGIVQPSREGYWLPLGTRWRSPEYVCTRNCQTNIVCICTAGPNNNELLVCGKPTQRVSIESGSRMPIGSVFVFPRETGGLCLPQAEDYNNSNDNNIKLSDVSLCRAPVCVPRYVL